MVAIVSKAAQNLNKLAPMYDGEIGFQPISLLLYNYKKAGKESFLMIKDLILQNRSYRRFHQERVVEMDTLRELVDLARLSPSGYNRQALRYFLSCQPDVNDRINAALGWAGYLQDWDGPEEGEKPAAFIVMLIDTKVGATLPQDQGFAAQNILLGAVEKGLGGCFLANINKKILARELNLDEKYEIAAVIAIGYPREEIMLEVMDESGNVKYWRDEQGIHHVPKRNLDDIIL